jgi:DNA-binding SARP family transcriptional activator/tRNA A-37 threonylcarbamoyl transferase component Bud32
MPLIRRTVRLHTFGGLGLTDGTEVVAPQRRRLALLALLAVAGERGCTRDKLMAYLWPESTSEAARHGLQQLLYYLRRQAHGELFLGTDPLRLNAEAITSDVAEFDAALAAGSLSEAVALYRGPFLDGFFLGDSAAFEEWAAQERSRLATAHAAALYRLARQAGAAEQHTLEIAHWRALVSADPLSERAATGLIRALAAGGDWTAALQHARAYEARLRAELPTPPAVSPIALVERLRAEHVVAAPPGPAAGNGGPEPRYRVERELGRGAAATVFLAHDRKHDRPVALKVLNPDLAATLSAKRFRREIAILARLHHPHILPLYDSDEEGRYFVVPFVAGESLRQRLAREVQLPLETALRITSQVADALGYAHECGFVHRDIKPENVLLEGQHAFVADFGIAHVLEAAGGERLSASGVALGTPAYMSPEQGRGSRRLDGRSDVYSLACVLYEMLAGVPPFAGRSPQVILARHAADPVPPVRTVCPEVPAGVEHALVRALAKDPADRWPSAAAFRGALRV